MNKNSPYPFALAAVLAWSTVSTAFKLSLRHLTPLGLLLFSALASSLFLAAYSLIRHGWKGIVLAAENWKRKLLAGLLNPFVYYLMLFSAYDRLPAQQAQVLNYTWAIVLSLFSALVFRRRFRLRDLICLCLSFLGVVLISTQGRILTMEFTDPLGALLAVCTSFIWAAFWILNLRDGQAAESKMLANFLSGTLATLLYALLRGKLNYAGLFDDAGVPLWGILGALYVGVFEMGLTFVLWQKALERSDNTAAVANLIFLTPFLSLLFIAMILKESINPATLIGLFIIIGSNLWQKKSGRTSDSIVDQHP